MGTIDSIFCNAIDIESPRARNTYLDEACGGDGDVRRRVEKLLAAHFNGAGLLDAPPPGLPDIGTDHFTGVDAAPLDAVAPGTTVDGRYRLLEVIGEGGMGVVYKAEQTRPVRRMVALKLIKLGMDTREVVARFHAERQALALMENAHVARVFDAGATESGRPYFVMEHVPGEVITAYCDRNQLKIPERLRLFVQACEAVHHAHQKAILHRDLKPGNILVAVAEGKGSAGAGEPTVKIIDFGIAKALGGPLTERTLCTSLAQLVGTPEYMSPEQAGAGGGGGGAGHDVDTRSDIYSLGVVLYELVTGAPPWDPKTFRGATPGDVQRIIREHEPPRPSTRLSSLSNDEAARAAERRASQPRALLGQLRSELEWIPLKAMAKDRDERYRSVAELADDVRNYLEHRPLIAGPRTRAYRLRKFLAKHDRAVAAATGIVAVVIGLVVGLAVAARQAVLARRATEASRHLAEGEAERAAAQRDRAVAAEGAADAERRRAEVLLAESLLDRALALDAAGAAEPAWEGFDRAADAFARVGLPARAAELGLLRSFDSHPPPLAVLAGHTGEILSIAVSHDGALALTASKDGTVRSWDVLAGRPLRTFGGHDGWVNAVALSPDGASAVSAGDDGTVRLWNVNTGAARRVLRGHAKAVRAVAFCPDGRRAVSGGDDGTLRLWDLQDGRTLQTLRGHHGSVRAVAVTPDGRRALAGADGGAKPSLTLWDLETGSTLRVLDAKRAHRSFDNGVSAIAVLPGGTHAVTGGYDHAVKRWDLTREAPPEQLVGGLPARVSLALPPGGATLLVGGDDGALKLYDLDAGTDRRTYHGCGRGVRAVAVSGDGRLVLAAGLDDKLRAWAARGTREAQALATREPYARAWFTRDARVCVTETRGETVVAYDTATGRSLGRFSRRDNAVKRFLEGQPARLLRRDERDTVVLSHWGDGEAELLRIPRKPAWTCEVEASADGRLVLFTNDEGEASLWDAGTGRQRWSHVGHRGPTTGCFSPCGTRVATAGTDHVVVVRNTDTGEPLCRVPYPGAPAFTFSPDGRRLLTGDATGDVRLWDAGDGRELRRFAGHGSAVVTVQLRVGGHTAATAGADGIVRLWDVDTGLPAGTFGGPGRLLTWDLSDDGRALVTARQTQSRRATLRTLMLDRAALHRQFHESLTAARRVLATQPDDAPAMQVIGEWYAFRGLNELALPFLEAARDRDALAPALPLARCYWQLGQSANAAREFRRAIERRELPPAYLDLCVNALVETPP